jgi:acylphosphatase/archaellum component FlaC
LGKGLIRARIVVEGNVQKVGYRDFVDRIAKDLGIKGFVENLKDGRVQIVCETEEKILDDFIKKIKITDAFIDVKKVQVVETSPATGEFEYFFIKYGSLEEELSDRMVMAIKYAGAMWKDLKSETSGIRQDIKEMHKDLKSETSGIRQDIKEMHKDLKSETSGIRQDIKEMHLDVKKSFQDMAERYDSISAELIRTREELTRAVDTLSDLIKQFLKQQEKLEKKIRSGERVSH